MLRRASATMALSRRRRTNHYTTSLPDGGTAALNLSKSDVFDNSEDGSLSRGEAWSSRDEQSGEHSLTSQPHFATM